MFSVCFKGHVPPQFFSPYFLAEIGKFGFWDNIDFYTSFDANITITGKTIKILMDFRILFPQGVISEFSHEFRFSTSIYGNRLIS